MKHLLFILGTLISFNTMAAVVDNFKCETKFTATDVLYPNITNQFELNMVRMPATENDIYTSTKAHSYQNVEIKTARQDSYLIKMDYSYIHALKKVTTGEATDARLVTCVNVSVSANGTPMDFSCLDIPNDPFNDTTNRWSKVTVTDGTPNIPIRLWKFNVNMPEGNVSIVCNKMGTIK